MNYNWDSENNWHSDMPNLNKINLDFFDKLDKVFFDICNIFISDDLIPFDKIIKYNNLINSKILSEN